MIRVVNSKDDASTSLYISGDIIDDVGGDWFEDDSIGVRWPDSVKRDLDAIDANAPLNVYINSDGGSVPAGVAIANMIARHKGKTTAIVDGWCCSIATQIFFSCDEKKMPSNAYLMIHKPAMYACGNADELLKVAEMLDTIQNGLESIYVKNARDGVTDAQIHEMVNSETWLTGKQAAEYFNIDVIEPLQVAAFARGKAINRYFNVPKDTMPKARKNVNAKNDDEIGKILYLANSILANKMEGLE